MEMQIRNGWSSCIVINEHLQKFGYVNGKNFNVSTGASKVAIIFPKNGLVFKWCGHDDEVVDEAAQEAENYAKAVQAGLSCFFPKTELYTCEGITKKIAVQEQIDYSAFDIPASAYKRYQRITRTVDHNIYEKVMNDILSVGGWGAKTINYTWAMTAISLYGKKKVKNLCKFIIENKINDLHDSNVGFKNRKPIILDFSGYYR